MKKSETTKAKKTTTKVVSEKVSCKVRVDFLSKYISQNKYTQKELLEMMNEKFVAHTSAANATILVDSKNVLYNQFEKLVLCDANTKVLSFANYSAKKIAAMKKKAQNEKESKKALSEKKAS